jgi:hypothetical protein
MNYFIRASMQPYIFHDSHVYSDGLITTVAGISVLLGPRRVVSLSIMLSVRQESYLWRLSSIIGRPV